MKKRLMVAAIAKDEAAYLPEWIAYHLMLGVDHIRVFVNNLEDNTRELLETIALFAPISIYEADIYWQKDKSFPIDNLTNEEFFAKNHFQARAMSKMYRMATLEGYDYFTSIDVDEFIYLGGYSLEYFLTEVVNGRPTRLQWFNVAGEADEFSHPIVGSLAGDFVPLHKLIIPTGINGIVFSSPHSLVHTRPKDCLSFSGDNAPCIIHRYHRSEREYLSMLGKGDVLHTVGQLKSNRVGFDLNPRSSLLIPQALIDNFETAYQHMLAENGVSDHLIAGRKFVLQRAQFVKDYFAQLSEDESNKLRMFDGTMLKPGKACIKFWN
ncbi:glycosyltransferase family 2 protein [uncultured Umboniibacter sp.]|uniref:glycosyltransferase family 2 protein n=1 Tax=uncultured Umboniibacter sp. TaxID=1798917 RepID=UPI00261EA3ED|nr:glycosyltransferase family 2 protein [uncultured Umboniibacter sp.]